MKTRHYSSIIIALFIFQLTACRSTPPANPAPEEISWVTYSNEKIDCTLEYPDVYAIDEDADRQGVIFRYDGFPVMLVRYTGEQEGRKRGLWFGHEPAGEIELAGIAGKKYIYEHFDGPISMKTIAYVVPYRNEYLGLEFRTELDEPDEVQKQVLKSFGIIED